MEEVSSSYKSVFITGGTHKESHFGVKTRGSKLLARLSTRKDWDFFPPPISVLFGLTNCLVTKGGLELVQQHLISMFFATHRGGLPALKEFN